MHVKMSKSLLTIKLTITKHISCGKTFVVEHFLNNTLDGDHGMDRFTPNNASIHFLTL